MIIKQWFVMGGGGSLGKKEDGGRQSHQNEICLTQTFSIHKCTWMACVLVLRCFYLLQLLATFTHTSMIVHNMKRIWPIFTFI